MTAPNAKRICIAQTHLSAQWGESDARTRHHRFPPAVRTHRLRDRGDLHRGPGASEGRRTHGRWVLPKSDPRHNEQSRRLIGGSFCCHLLDFSHDRWVEAPDNELDLQWLFSVTLSVHDNVVNELP